MKRRILSLILVLAMVLPMVTGVFATETGFAPNAPVDETTPSGLTLVEEGTDTPADRPAVSTSDITVNATVKDNGDKVTQSALEQDNARPSDAAVKLSAEDEVTFIVTLYKRSLLDVGYSVADISAQTAAVASYEASQTTALADTRTQITAKLGKDVAFGYTFTVASTALSVTTAYGNMETLAALPGVKSVYVAPTFSLPESNGSLVPQTMNATTMIGADKLNETGFTGKGMKIAILDTGIELSHPNFKALDESALTATSMTQKDVEDAWSSLKASQGTSVPPAQVYRSTKIPFAFNYVLKGLDVSHAGAGSDHGTHVAGIAAANFVDRGDEGTSVIGVAPDAQLVVMQVFGGGSAGWDVIMAALEDCTRLGVDAANLSLGAAAGFTDNSEPMNAVMAKLEEAGVQVIIAAGNDTSNAYGNNYSGYSLSKNPDTGLVGTPSTYSTTLSIASADNDSLTTRYFTVNGQVFGYNDTAANTAAPNAFTTLGTDREFSFVYVDGFGTKESFEGIDVTDKIVVVSRGGNSFPEKQANAQAAGAKACIVHNNAAGFINMQINNTVNDIPCVGITQADGEKLKAMGEGKLVIASTFTTIQMDRTISNFSSWGCTPDLKLKPEITGVGGDIYSTRGFDFVSSGYGTMSGTSMATPQVAGAMAVLNQFLLEAGYTDKDVRWDLAARLMMSTADPMMYSDTLEFSPRAQGAGLINLVDATSAGAYMTNPDAKFERPKAELGESDDGTYSFQFAITNFSDTDKTYTFSHSLFTETLDDKTIPGVKLIAGRPYALGADLTITAAASKEVTALCYDFNGDETVDTADARVLLRHVNGTETVADTAPFFAYLDVDGSKTVDKADVMALLNTMAGLTTDLDLEATFTYTVSGGAVTEATVAAGETAKFTVSIALTEDDKTYMKGFENGEFVEGYLYARTDKDNETLVMPIMGFYGDWSKAPLFDSEGDDYSLYPRSVFTNASVLGRNPYIRLSTRGGDDYNAVSYGNPLAEIDIGMLRNARTMRFTVTDKVTGEEYFTLSGDYETKSYFNAGYGSIVPFYIYNDMSGTEYVWRGYNKGKQLPSGTRVIYKVEAWLDDGDEVVDDTWSFELTIDSKKPEIVNLNELSKSLDVSSGNPILTLQVKDDAQIAAILFLNAKGRVVGKYEPDETYKPGEVYELKADITGYGSSFTVVVADYACNELEAEVILEGDLSGLTPTPKVLEKDRLYGCESYSGADMEKGWFSVNLADASDKRNETFETQGYNCAEYVNGKVIAQRSGGDLVLLTPYGTFWDSQLVYDQIPEVYAEDYITLYDMALDYTTNTLYATGWTYDANKKGANNLYKIQFPEYGNPSIETLGTYTGLEAGVELLTLACTDDGQLYGMGMDGALYKLDKDSRACTKIRVLTEYTSNSGFKGLNVIQSMCYDHNAEGEDVIYLAATSQTAYTWSVSLYSRLLKLTLGENGDTVKVDIVPNTWTTSGASCLFIPTDKESKLFALDVKPTYVQLSSPVTILEGQKKLLEPKWEPWNAKPENVVWTSSDDSIVKVNEYGRIEGVKAGNATITGKTRYWNQWHHWDPEAGASVADWSEITLTCNVTVKPSQDQLIGFIAVDNKNESNMTSWVTYSDLDLRNPVQVGKSPNMWYGGAYYEGNVYAVQEEKWDKDGVMYKGTALYKQPVTFDADGQVSFGELTLVGRTAGITVGNMGFDYHTGQMYGVDLTHNGLCVIDLDTGAVDALGGFTSGFWAADPPVTMGVICKENKETIVLVGDTGGNLYQVNMDTMACTQVASSGQEYWYYGAMTYDYSTGNLYWAPSNGQYNNPLYVVNLVPGWEEGTYRGELCDLGSLVSSYGVEQTILFTNPDGKEPDTTYVDVKNITIEGGDRTALVGGEFRLVSVTDPVRPSVKSREWTSSDENVAVVDSFGYVTCKDVGETTITVTLTDKNGNVRSDSMKLTVLASAGDLVAYMADDTGTNWNNFWITLPDHTPTKGKQGTFAGGLYQLATGAYFDGSFYCYTSGGDFLRIDAEDHAIYEKLGKWNLEGNGNRIVAMTFDYKSGTMYALSEKFKTWNSNNYSYDYYNATLYTVNLADGTLKEVMQFSDNELISTIAADMSGKLYGVGSPVVTDGTDPDAKLYTIDTVNKSVAMLTTLEGVKVRATRYGACTPMTYDAKNDRLYFKAEYNEDEKTWNTIDGGLIMVQLDDGYKCVDLGMPALNLRGEAKVGNMNLSLLCAIPTEEYLPDVEYVTYVRVDRHAMQMIVGEDVTITATVAPASGPKTVKWTSDNENVVKVDASGKVTAVGAGSATITATSTADDTKSDSCKVNVVESTNGILAYALTPDGLVSFDPENANKSTVVAKPSEMGVVGDNLANVVGMDVSGRTAYIVTENAASAQFPVLYKFDMDSKILTPMGSLQVFTVGASDVYYDAKTDCLYMTCGFYVFEYWLPSLKAGELNGPSRFLEDTSGQICSVAGTADGKLFYLVNAYGEVYMREITRDGSGMNMVYRPTITGMTAARGTTEMTFDDKTQTFFITNPSDELYTITMADLEKGDWSTSKSVAAKLLGDAAGYSVSGFAIAK